MKFELVAISDKRPHGETESNVLALVARRLASFGGDCSRHTVVGPDEVEARQVIQEALARADVVIVYGDPMIRDWGPLVRRANAVIHPDHTFGDIAMSAPARVIGDKDELDNVGKLVCVLPPVTAQIDRMLDQVLLPYLRFSGESSHPVESRTLRCAGISEMAAADLLRPVFESLGVGLETGFVARPGEVWVRLTVSGTTSDAVLSLLRESEAAVRAALGRAVYTADDESLELVVWKLLRGKSQKLALFESFTGGLIAARISELPNAWECFVGSIIRRGRVLMATAAIDGGSYSASGARQREEAAIRVAEESCRVLNANVCLTSIGQLHRHSDREPDCRLVLAVVSEEGTRSSELERPVRDLHHVRSWAVTTALDFLRRTLEDASSNPPGPG
jgi:molybdopterin-biosynthesis enzyme MoeA-like protein